MDLRSLSNPTVASRLDPLDSSKANDVMPGAAELAGSERSISLSNAKIPPRFKDTLELFRDQPLGPDSAKTRFEPMSQETEHAKARFSDTLDLNASGHAAPAGNGKSGLQQTSELEEKFTEFVGQTLFGSMLASMRKTLGKPAYMHGGRTEEVFQQQLDQVIVEDLTEASADSIAAPMFDLFSMQKRSS